MLLRWDNRNAGQAIAIPTPIADWEGVYYEPSLDLPDGAMKSFATIVGRMASALVFLALTAIFAVSHVATNALARGLLPERGADRP